MPNGLLPHILIVDDDDAIGSLLADAIAGYGYRATYVCDGNAMRGRLKADRIDAVVLDIRMPNDDSHSLAVHIKKLGLPVVMMSGQRDNVFYIAKLGLPVLRKPFRIVDLANVLATVLAAHTASAAQ